MAHIARALPGIAKSTKAFRAMLMSRGIERWEKGSTRKDLFYWLVCRNRMVRSSR